MDWDLCWDAVGSRYIHTFILSPVPWNINAKWSENLLMFLEKVNQEIWTGSGSVIALPRSADTHYNWMSVLDLKGSSTHAVSQMGRSNVTLTVQYPFPALFICESEKEKPADVQGSLPSTFAVVETPDSRRGTECLISLAYIRAQECFNLSKELFFFFLLFIQLFEDYKSCQTAGYTQMDKDMKRF